VFDRNGAFENESPNGIIGSKREKTAEEWSFIIELFIIRVISIRIIRRMEHFVTHGGG
jgi:hypothetical protein